MAERRMFAKKIVESAKFLKMPSSSQNLYFHLGINADDDGVVEAYSVLNLIKANEDDLKILLGKGFIDILNEDLVAFIVDWRENNYLRADRKADSIYKGLILQMRPNEKLVEKKQRSDVKEKTMSIHDNKFGQSMDCEWTAQYRIEENSIEKNNIEKNNIGECIAVLGNETLTVTDYNELLKKHQKDLVNAVIKKIVSHPYVNCLNLPVIEQWCNESKNRNNMEVSDKNNRFSNLMQRDYNYDELERNLLKY